MTFSTAQVSQLSFKPESELATDALERVLHCELLGPCTQWTTLLHALVLGSLLGSSANAQVWSSASMLGSFSALGFKDSFPEFRHCSASCLGHSWVLNLKLHRDANLNDVMRSARYNTNVRTPSGLGSAREGGPVGGLHGASLLFRRSCR